MKCLKCLKHKAFTFGIICPHCHAGLKRAYGNIVKAKVLAELSEVKPARFLAGTGEGALR